MHCIQIAQLVRNVVWRASCAAHHLYQRWQILSARQALAAPTSFLWCTNVSVQSVVPRDLPAAGTVGKDTTALKSFVAQVKWAVCSLPEALRSACLPAALDCSAHNKGFVHAAMTTNSMKGLSCCLQLLLIDALLPCCLAFVMNREQNYCM